VGETHQLGRQRGVEMARQVVPVGIERELRHAVVRRIDRRQRVLQGLELCTRAWRCRESGPALPL
jgi:hypothetical protein